MKAPKKKRKIEEKTVLLVKYGDKIAIRKRDDTGLLASCMNFRIWKENFQRKRYWNASVGGASVEEKLPEESTFSAMWSGI